MQPRQLLARRDLDQRQIVRFIAAHQRRLVACLIGERHLELVIVGYHVAVGQNFPVRADQKPGSLIARRIHFQENRPPVNGAGDIHRRQVRGFINLDVVSLVGAQPRAMRHLRPRPQAGACAFELCPRNRYRQLARDVTKRKPPTKTAATIKTRHLMLLNSVATHTPPAPVRAYSPWCQKCRSRNGPPAPFRPGEAACSSRAITSSLEYGPRFMARSICCSRVQTTTIRPVELLITSSFNQNRRLDNYDRLRVRALDLSDHLPLAARPPPDAPAG